MTDVAERAYYWLHSMRGTDAGCRANLMGLRDNNAVIGDKLQFEIGRYDASLSIYDYLLSLVPVPESVGNANDAALEQAASRSDTLTVTTE